MTAAPLGRLIPASAYIPVIGPKHGCRAKFVISLSYWSVNKPHRLPETILSKPPACVDLLQKQVVRRFDQTLTDGITNVAGKVTCIDHPAVPNELMPGSDDSSFISTTLNIR